MQAFLIRSLLLINLCTCFQACVPQHFGKVQKIGSKPTAESGLKAPFEADFKSFVFKAKLDYGKKYTFGGVVALKQMEEAVYRMVFMTKFGMTMFDFEFGKNGFVVHKAFEQLNRPLLLKVMENDMRLLLLSGQLGKKTTVFENKDSTQNIYHTTLQKKSIWAAENTEKQTIYLQKGSEVHIELKDYQKGRPKLITIEHKTIPLRMELTRIK